MFLIACDTTEDYPKNPIPADESMLVGKWKLTKAYISSGGPRYWVDIENGDEFEFFENGTFSSNRFSECMNGNFLIEESDLLLEYNCSEFNTGLEDEEGFITYRLEFFTDFFMLTPTSGPICIEGCSYKYQSIK